MSIKNDKIIDNWSEKYLDTLETIYGFRDLHPLKMLEEINLEWLGAFMSSDESNQDNLLVEEWTESYLNIYAILYGPFTLHAPMDVEEMNQRWIEYYYEESTIIYNIDHAA